MLLNVPILRTIMDSGLCHSSQNSLLVRACNVTKYAAISPRLEPYEIRRVDYATPLYLQNMAITTPTSGGRSVGIVRSQTKATELLLYPYSYFFSHLEAQISNSSVLCVLLQFR
jgi:hypothetical protein